MHRAVAVEGGGGNMADLHLLHHPGFLREGGGQLQRWDSVDSSPAGQTSL